MKKHGSSYEAPTEEETAGIRAVHVDLLDPAIVSTCIWSDKGCEAKVDVAVYYVISKTAPVANGYAQSLDNYISYVYAQSNYATPINPYASVLFNFIFILLLFPFLYTDLLLVTSMCPRLVV